MNQVPKHYDKDPSPLQVIEAWELGFLEGNILKYLARWREKGGLDDLEKLQHCAALLIESARKARHRTEVAESFSSASATHETEQMELNYG